MFAKLFSAAFLAAILCSSTDAGAEEKARLDAQAARAVMKSMDIEPTLVAHSRSCPADVFRKDATVGGLLLPEEEIAEGHCARNPAECLSACLTRGSGVHCFRLAVAFQGVAEIAPTRYPQMLFATACALGKASGCTNRAASLRNAMADDDPLQRLTGKQLELCQFRSFKTACEQRDSWGCAMLGQSYRRGEGAAANKAWARQSYNKACEIAPDFGSCRFAKSGLEEMRRR